MQNKDGKPLDVLGSEKRPRSQGGGGWRALLTQAVVSAIVTFVMLMTIAPSMLVSHTDFDTNIKVMTATIDTANAQVKTSSDALAKAIAGLPNTVTSQVNSVMTQVNNQLNSLNTLVSSMQTQVSNMASIVKSASDKADQANSVVSSLNSKVNTLMGSLDDDETTIDKLTERIKALEDAQITPTASSGITAKIKSMSSVLSASDNHTLVGSFRITLANTTSSDVSDIILCVAIETDTILGSHVASLSGGGISWQKQGYDPVYAEFVNGTWGLKVAKKSTATLYLTLTITDSGTVDYLLKYGNTGVLYNVTVTVE